MRKKKHIVAYIQSKAKEMVDLQMSLAHDKHTPAAVRAGIAKDVLDRA